MAGAEQRVLAATNSVNPERCRGSRITSRQVAGRFARVSHNFLMIELARKGEVVRTARRQPYAGQLRAARSCDSTLLNSLARSPTIKAR